MNQKLEAAIKELRKAADKVFVEYDGQKDIIIISATNQERTELAEKRQRFLHGELFTLTGINDGRRFKFVEKKGGLDHDIYELNYHSEGFSKYCTVHSWSEEEILFRIIFLGALIIEQPIPFKNLIFFS